MARCPGETCFMPQSPLLLRRKCLPLISKKTRCRRRRPEVYSPERDEPPDEALLETDRAMLPARLSPTKSSPELSSEQSAIPEHVIDVPTMQGFLATRPIDGISDPLAAQSGDAIARVHGRTSRRQNPADAAVSPSRLRDETPRQRLDVGPLIPTVGDDAGTCADRPGGDRRAAASAALADQAFCQAVLPNATAQMLPVSPHETAKLDPVPSSQTMRFPTLPTSQRVPARSVPITAPPPSYSAEIPSPSDPDKGESTAEIARRWLLPRRWKCRWCRPTIATQRVCCR